MNKKSLLLSSVTVLMAFFTFAQTHTSYLWHLQQPIYWPEQGGGNGYQFVKESHDIKMGGGNTYGTGTSHPTNDLEEIFSKNDRKNIYQHDVKNSVSNITWLPEAGAQVNYSGCLIENVNSLANANQWGYYPGWEQNFVEARGWQTSGGFPRVDLVGFTYHHALSPLISERAFRKELQAHRHIYGQTFGYSPDYTKGYWPAECCFSERNIKVLTEEGFEWSVIANSHLARTLNDYPLHYGTNGCNISPPNKADIVETNGNNWWNGQVDGRGGEFAAPYCYQAHKAKYVNPETGEEYIMDVVPMADLLSYKDGYSPQSTDDITTYIQPYEDPAHPTLVLFAHDGDNAWGGGSSYYFEAVPNFVSAANSVGIVPTTIQQFLNDHPVPEDDIVKVEDGGWVNASSDWGHPQFINWLWPLYDPSTYRFDPDAWTEDARNWAVITAAENHTIMAEDLEGGVDIEDIVYPSGSSSQAELAWHFFLPSLTSGYMYYGTAEDMEVKQTIAGNNAIMHAQVVINNNSGTDNTAPSVFIPQRFPYNPGGREFGPIYGYQEHISSQDFHIWTYGYDVSGIATATLKYRLDEDGTNPLNDNANDTYAGGAGVGDWISISMDSKVLDPAFNGNNPEVDFFVLPDAMADLYYAEITGLSDTLVDYYVEMTDNYGNTFKTPIQHVYVGGEDGGGSGNDQVYWEPTDPTLNDMITIYSTEAVDGSMLHWGVDDAGTWVAPIVEYHPSGTVIFDAQAVQTPFTDPDNDGLYTCVIGPFNNASQVVEQINFVVKINESIWDNNGGMDYHIEIENNPSINPVGSDQSVSTMINTTYNFETDDFYFQGVNGATFAGITIASEETAGNLLHDGTPVVATNTYSDVSLLSFTPEADQAGVPYATFTFRVVDSEGNESLTDYTMTINVYDYNPLSEDNSITLEQNEFYTFAEADFPFTGQGGATFAGIKVIDPTLTGTFEYDGSSVASNQICNDISLLTFEPLADESGSPYTSFTFKVLDSEGRESNDNYTMTINVTSLNPTSANSSVTMLMNETFTFANTNFAFNGQGGATFAAFQISDLPTLGTLSYDGSPVSANTDYADPTLLEFTPETNAYGSPYTTFNFVVKDSEGRYSDDEYTMTINVLEQILGDVSWFPENPTSNDQITIFVNNDPSMSDGAMLHWGVNNATDWESPIAEYYPAGSTLFQGTGPAVESPFVEQSSSLYMINIGPFNNPSQEVSSVHFVLHYADDTWNNNSDQNWEIPITIINDISEGESDELKIAIYPNPMSEFAIIDLSENKATTYTTQLTDITGKVLMQDEIQSPTKYVLNRNNLENGIYMLRFVDEKSGETFVRKLMIY